MTALDCESYESSVRSIAHAYNANTAGVTAFLSSVDLGEDNYLLELFESRFGRLSHMWDSVCWFHLTRVPANSDFAEGILPLSLALEKIWKAMIAAVGGSTKKASLERLRVAGVPDDLYNLKTTDPRAFGPYAMLVRESAFHSREMGNHDYLELPEIIEDICNGYKRRYGESIDKEISSALRKCIVKFEIPPDRPGAALAAPTLLYCWCKIHNESLSTDTNTCYDANGVTIPPSTIVGIEFP